MCMLLVTKSCLCIVTWGKFLVSWGLIARASGEEPTSGETEEANETPAEPTAPSVVGVV